MATDTELAPATAGGAVDAPARRRLPWPDRERLLAYAPVAALIVVQLVLFPLPGGIWLRGVIVGGLTALIALGMALTYQANRVVSFAQADLGMAPVVLTTLLITAWDWPWLVAAVAGLLVSALLGAIVELGVIRRFRHSPRLLLMVATIGLAQVLGGLALVLPDLFDVERLPSGMLEAPFEISFEFGGTIFGANDVLALIAIPVGVAALAVGLGRTRLGLAVRAVADRADRASMLGIPAGRVHTAVWAVAGVLAFAAVFLRAGVLGLPVGAALSLGILLRALAALLIGRFTDLPVVAAAAVALGILELGVSWRFNDAAVVDAVLAAVVVGVLLLRRRRDGRAGDDGGSWRSVGDARTLPPEVARLAPIRALRWGGLTVGLLVLVVLPQVLTVDRNLRASALLVYAILGLSVVVLTGWTGLVSLGQVALFAIGAATGAYATGQMGLDITIGLVVAGLCGGIAAVVIGFPALRLRGVELGVVTLAVALATTSWLLNPRVFDWVPNRRVERPALLGRIDIDSPTRIYVLVVVVLVLSVIAVVGVRRSRTGRALLALRDNERAAQAYGLSPLRLRLTAFAMSGAIAGVAGGLFVHHQQAFGQQPYLPEQNLVVFTMVVLGGVTSPLGALLGATWLQGTRWFLPAQWQLLASGAGVMFILLFLPDGLAGAVLRLRDRLVSRITGGDDPGVEATPADGDGPPATDLAEAGDDVLVDAEADAPPLEPVLVADEAELEGQGVGR